MNTKEILVNTRAFFSEEGKWCQGSSARNAKGHAVYQDSDEAFSFCLLGALFFEKPRNQNDETYNKAYKIVRKTAGDISLVDFNDDPHTSFVDIINVLDVAIDSV